MLAQITTNFEKGRDISQSGRWPYLHIQCIIFNRPSEYGNVKHTVNVLQTHSVALPAPEYRSLAYNKTYQNIKPPQQCHHLEVYSDRDARTYPGGHIWTYKCQIYSHALTHSQPIATVEDRSINLTSFNIISASWASMQGGGTTDQSKLFKSSSSLCRWKQSRCWVKRWHGLKYTCGAWPKPVLIESKFICFLR